MIRLLKGAKTPQINDYNLESKFKDDCDDFEIIEFMKAASKVEVTVSQTKKSDNVPEAPISFFDTQHDADSEDNAMMASIKNDVDRFALLSFSSPHSSQDTRSHHTSRNLFRGPLELKNSFEDIGKGENIHQLAAKKAVSELEKNGGWFVTATDKSDGTLIKTSTMVLRDGKGDVEYEAVVFGARPQPSSFTQAPLPAIVQMRFRRSPSGPTGLVKELRCGIAAAFTFSISAYGSAKPTNRRRSLYGVIRFDPVSSDHDPELTSFPSGRSDGDTMHELLRLPRFDGSWERDQPLWDILGIEPYLDRRNNIDASASAIAEDWLGQRYELAVVKKITGDAELVESART
ncbi:hypothetical protein F5Y03DRAFT_394645 [Xylaria venustula]|nr:hypothetical protein F5Y03DRAFT_394645 [Xylaria venustula]